MWQFLRKLAINLHQDPAVSLDHTPKRCSILPQGFFSTIFTVTLFIIVKNWKQLRCLSTEIWIKKNVLYINNLVLLIIEIEKSNIIAFSGKRMELENILRGGYHDSDKQTLYLITHKYILNVKYNRTPIHRPIEGK